MIRFIQSVYSKYDLIRSFFYFSIVRRFFDLLLSFFLSILSYICLALLILVQPISGFQDYFTHSVSYSLSSFVPFLCSCVFVFSVVYFILRLVFFLDFFVAVVLNRIDRCG